MSAVDETAVVEEALAVGDLTRHLHALLDAHRDAHAARTEHAEALRSALQQGAEVVRPGDLCAPNDAVELLGVDRTTVSRWGTSGYLPPPFQVVGGVPLRLRSVLEAFAVKHRETADAAGRRPPGTAR
jgi:membrane protein required for beta-lactamase induction